MGSDYRSPLWFSVHGARGSDLLRLDSQFKQNMVPPLGGAVRAGASHAPPLHMTECLACAANSQQVYWLNVDPVWNTLRSEPRFEALIEKLDLGT